VRDRKKESPLPKSSMITLRRGKKGFLDFRKSSKSPANDGVARVRDGRQPAL
jgi:hypothetical protein